MRTGARPVGKSPARGSARARAFERKKKKKKSPPRGPAAFRPVLAGERACASAQRRPPQLLPSIGGLAHSSAVPTSPEARALGVGTSRLAERGVSQPEEGWRRTGLGEREKPPSRSEELGHGQESAEDTPPSLTPLGAAEVLWRLARHGGDRWTTIPRRRRGAAPTAPGNTCAPGLPPPRPPSSLLLPRAKLQFPGGFAQSGLEVGSLEVTRATRAGGVSSERRGAGRRGRGARGAGSSDAQVCGFGSRRGLTQGWRGIGVPSDPEGQRGLETRRTAEYGHRLWGAAALGLAPSGPHRTCARMAQLSRRATQHCMEEHGVGVG